MTILQFLAWFASAVLLTNAVPHTVAGLQGRSFQSPFAKPPGVGVSSPLSNVVWGFINLAIGWALVTQIGAFDIANPAHAAAIASGGLLMGLYLARYFGRFHAAKD